MAKNKKNKKKKKNSSKSGLISFIILIIIVVAVIVICLPSYNKSSEALKEFNDLKSEFSELVTDKTENNIPMITKESQYWDYKFSSSDESLITNEGVVKRPSYTIGDKEVKVYLECTLKNIELMDQIVFQLVSVKNQKIELTTTIIKLPQTNIEKLKEAREKLDLPKIIYTDLGLPSKLSTVPDVNLTWSSMNQAIITNEGIKMTNGKTIMICDLSIGTDALQKSFDVEVEDYPIFNEVNLEFEDFSQSSYSNMKYQNVDLVQAKSDSGKLKLRVLDDTKGEIITGLINNSQMISFNYSYAGENTTFKYVSTISLFKSVDKENWELVKDESLVDADNHLFTCSLSGDFYYKISITTEYAEKFFNIDNLYIKRGITKDDVINNISIPKIVRENIDLPSTTKIGGKVEYESDNSSLTKLGVCTREDESQKVNLKVKISGFPFPIEFNVEVTVPGTLEKTPVEIRFIDVGKYGLNDCGESILIKYEDTEILIDAGDEPQSTFKAVSEAIDKYCEDGVLDYIISTHPDSDHIGSMNDVINNYTVKHIITFMGTASTKVYQDYETSVQNEGAEVCKVLDSYNNVGTCKRTIYIADEVFIEIINTQNYNQEENNARSIVCILNAYGVKTLFTGDADNKSSELEKAYMNNVGNVDILKIVHHGSKEGTSSEFLEAIDPETVIVCNGNYFGNKHGHPTYEALNRVYTYDENIKMYAIVGGESDNCSMTDSGSFKCESENNDTLHDRNGMITITITGENNYTITSEYFGLNPIEVKNTDFYKTRSLLG